MLNVYFIIFAFVFLECRFVQNFQDKTQAVSVREFRRDTDFLRLLSGNGLYNPMDPMGFIFEGNNKEYTGNGVDTPKYDPDNLAYRYAGAAFGSNINPFVPSFDSESINNSPNYAQPYHPTKPTVEQNVTNVVEEKNGIDKGKETFSKLPSATGMSSSVKFSEIASQTFPDNIMSALNINASNMFPDVKFSGQPGMLGIGSQVPAQVVIPDKSPVPDRQFLAAALRNVSETRVLPQVYDRYPGVVGIKVQTSFGTNGIDTSTPKPLYNGYPGMLGVGQMYSDTGNIGKEPVIMNGEEHSKGYSNRDQSGYHTGGGNTIGNNFISAIPGVNTNNWKGEWIGKTSSGGDWSGDWSEKWPKGDAQNKEDKENTSASQTENSAGRSNSNTAWDGSWPGSTKKDETTTKASNNLGDFGETMAALEKLMNMLSNIPASFDNSNNSAAKGSFSQMVSSWKEDMKSQ